MKQQKRSFPVPFRDEYTNFVSQTVVCHIPTAGKPQAATPPWFSPSTSGESSEVNLTTALTDGANIAQSIE